MCKLLSICLLGALAFSAGARSHAAEKTTYATWIMVWYGHDQAWWSTKNPDASKNLVNGQWKTLDWADEKQYGAYLDGIKKAGVTGVIADLTNGWGWLDARSRLIQGLCAKRGMKFCVAENSTGNTAQFESHASDIWKNFAGPDASDHEAYFHYRGKPLIVCYSVRDWYTSYLKMDTSARQRFSLVWASGEDSCINKWGWQLEPWVGSIPSKDSMYVTSAVRWNPADGAMWRKSIAWLDYNFALAKKNNPEYVIIGSYDDPTERNTWAISDTAHCELGRQIRDKTGALNPSALYDRVRQWISGNPLIEPGGLLRDGAYRIVSRSPGRHLGISKAEKPSLGAPGAMLAESKPDKTPNGLFWFYHLGGNHYRIIAVHSGLALEASGEHVVQNWDSTGSDQRWTLTRTPDGYFRLTNDATHKALALDGESAVLQPPSADQAQQWRLEPVVTL
jgi:hypothetical protein